MLNKKIQSSKDPLNLTTSKSGSSILIFGIVCIILSLLFYSFFAQNEFEKKLTPQLTRNAETIGKSIRSVILKTYNYGIPINTIRGYEEFFKSYLDRNDEIEYIALFCSNDSLIHFKKQNNSTLLKSSINKIVDSSLFSIVNIESSGEKIASLKIGIDKQYIVEKVNSITYDTITVMAITLLLTFELILFLIAVTVNAPIDSIQTILQNAIRYDFSRKLKIQSKDEIGALSETINKVLLKLNTTYSNIIISLKRHETNQYYQGILNKTKDFKRGKNLINPDTTISYFKTLLIYFRPTLFLVVFAESLAISFFPVYVNSMYTPILGMSKELITGLPISLFMLFWAISIPFGGFWSDRFGRKKPMVLGALITALGLGLTGFATNIIQLLIFRAITAIGFGTVYISAQGFIADNTTTKNRTTGMASFVACYFSGALSGAAIGGILVDRIGYSFTYISASLFAVLGAFFAYKYLNTKPTSSAPSSNKFKFNNIKYLISNRRFLSILFLASIPGKICLAGYMYYIAPIFLNSLGISNSSIGRFIIGYGLSMVILSPWSGKMADKTGNRHLYVLGGGLLGGFSLIIPLLIPNTIGILFSILGLGIAHAFAVSSQLAIVIHLFEHISDSIGSGSVIAIYRLIERIGNISGPIIAGILLSSFSYEVTAALIGTAVIIGAILYILSFLFYNFMDRKKS